MNTCPQCKGGDVIPGRLSTRLFIRYFGLLHFFMPKKGQTIPGFPKGVCVSKEYELCLTCGLMWQDVSEELAKKKNK